MNLKCLQYKLLDKFRFSPIATKLIYYGTPVQILQSNITVHGTVTSTSTAETDGDTCFNVTLDDGSFRHCEVTPCASDSVKTLARSLTVGQKVKLTGDERFDPHHHFDDGGGGWKEIHPVTNIEITKE